MEKKEGNRKEKATKEFPMTQSLGWLIVPVDQCSSNPGKALRHKA